MTEIQAQLKASIRTIPDFPMEGIMFRDITTLSSDPAAFKLAVDEMVKPYLGAGVKYVAGIDARGFIFGGAMAYQMGCGFLALRKKGKLPPPTTSISYKLEYGEAELEILDGALEAGDKVLLVDDLIATGGTAEAAVKLMQGQGADVLCAYFVIDLPELGGKEKIEALGVPVKTLVAYDGH